MLLYIFSNLNFFYTIFIYSVPITFYHIICGAYKLNYIYYLNKYILIVLHICILQICYVYNKIK